MENFDICHELCCIVCVLLYFVVLLLVDYLINT